MTFGELKVGEIFVLDDIVTHNKIYMKIQDEEGWYDWDDTAVDLKTGVATSFHGYDKVTPFPFTINFTFSI